MLIITTITAAILALVQVKLALGVVSIRKSEKVSLGDGEHASLQRANRAFGNLTEYTPIMLVLLACLEFNAFPVVLVIALAAPFTVGRILHPAGLLDAETGMKKRVLGMQLTLWPLLLAAAANLVWLLYRLIS